ncbi:glutamine-hydrolyzing GMP synthase [Deinococcus arenicola]|uniref:GMP synthase [glutamine-hydrolyzing] n=1 Tax=Deinococcus arenicola TaxID=2994950 RepID=A0ABU4DLZ4_9DEIO|nr:glutamine-hydrolyzing GMP synthase [Deinococcus sp. ZS9-10]MDV6373466.1 glutamine-hydrolyzing GMP synthase [Deinococcus sp. ZS9-10]
MSVVILDFGSQFTRLIARRFRELGAYSVILPGTATLERIQQENPQGIVLSGGPSSVYDDQAPKPAPGVMDLDIPILGVCYGMQYLAQQAGGDVKRAGKREYGKADLTRYGGQLFGGIQGEFVAWMSHSDSVTQLPQGYEVIAETADTPVAAIENTETRRYGLQFHPEVVHTPKGGQILGNFLDICGVSRDWTAEHIIDELIEGVQKQVGNSRVLLAISGGVDSSTLGLLLARAVGERLTAVFIDHGLLRLGEREQVEAALIPLGVHLVTVDARAEFMGALEGISDPEQKRKIIGREFIRAFEREAAIQAKEHGGFDFLAQGTLYPDVIESAGGLSADKTGAANIKSHHNVGGLPEDLNFKLVEPFRTLFKDEVREIAKLLGLPEHIRMRHPFPGPGLAIRCLGAISEDKMDILRRVDDIFISGLREFGLYDGCSQALAILTPIQSVGVMGDERTYSYTAALRAVTTDDYMTAEWARLPWEFLATMSNRIVNQVHEINRVVYDITGKPPATIEWE